MSVGLHSYLNNTGNIRVSVNEVIITFETAFDLVFLESESMFYILETKNEKRRRLGVAQSFAFYVGFILNSGIRKQGGKYKNILEIKPYKNNQ